MDKAIDRLFKRLSATYGAAWDRSLGESPINDVKTVWAHELSVYANSLHRIAWALENLPERCPNVIEFKKLCYSAPSPEALQLPEPKANPARVAAELAKLAPLREKLSAPVAQKDYKQWARVILANPEGRSPAAIQMAKNALEAV
jgi:hypothetical protein